MILATDAIRSSIAEGRRWADVAAMAMHTMPQPSGASAAGTNGALHAVPAVRETLAGMAHRLLDDLAVRAA